MPIGIMAGTALVGAGVSMYTGNKAAKAQERAADKADATNRYIFDTQRADFAPWRETGAAALGKLAGMYGVTPSGTTPGSTTGAATAGDYGGFTTSPGYQFRVDEAMKAIERSAAARGRLRSGATMDALQRRVQGEASSEYERFADRLAQMAGIGKSAADSTAAAGNNYANNQTQTNLAAGNARASAYANTGNAINSGIQNMASMYLYNKGFGG